MKNYETAIPGNGFHIKIGKAEHIKALQQRGLIYCNHISYYTKVENNLDKAQIDPDETAVEKKKLNADRIWLKPANEPKTPFKYLKINNAHLVKHYKDVQANLFCLYTFHIQNKHIKGEPFIIPLSKDFTGDTCLFIMNHHEFVNRITTHLKAQRISFESRFVNYNSFDQSHLHKSFFDKDQKYQDQNEYRFIIQGSQSGPFEFNIGSIEDITFMMPFEEVVNKWFVFKKVDEQSKLYELSRLPEN